MSSESGHKQEKGPFHLNQAQWTFRLFLKSFFFFFLHYIIICKCNIGRTQTPPHFFQFQMLLCCPHRVNVKYMLNSDPSGTLFVLRMCFMESA